MKTRTYEGKAGEYLCKCPDCGQEFLGDKRDFLPCGDCHYVGWDWDIGLPNQPTTKPTEQGAE